MLILAALPVIEVAGMLEAALIREFKALRKTPGIANVKGGGDNIVGHPPGFVYAVLMSAKTVHIMKVP